MLKPHIVILGSGFGGTYVAKQLVPYVRRGAIEVTVVNKTNYFLFTPLLHEVATGALSPTSVAEPLREIFVGTGVRIAQGSIESIDRNGRTVKLGMGSSSCSLAYDYLVVATGAETNYYNIPGAETFSYPLKNLFDAVRIRTRIIDSFERAIMTRDREERSKLLTFVVVGGGATGVEMAAELAEFVRSMARRYYSGKGTCDPDDHRVCSPEEPVVVLIHTGSELLQTFRPSLRSAALERLRHSGVDARLNTTVTEVTAHGIRLSGDTFLATATVVWAAGVKSVIPHFEGTTPASIAGRLTVDSHFRVAGDEHVFALGDVAGYVDLDLHRADPAKMQTMPMLAQVASAQSRTVADNIISAIRDKKLSEFHFHSKGSMVSVGQWFALGELYSMAIAGRLTWWLWRTVYLFKFASWKKRARIAFEWTLDMIYPRDITTFT